MKEHRGLDYIRNIPREAWKKKEWPISATTVPVEQTMEFSSGKEVENLSEENIPEEHEPEPEPLQEGKKIYYPEDFDLGG